MIIPFNCLKVTALAFCMVSAGVMCAENGVHYEADMVGNVSTAEFAPYFIGSLNGGKVVRRNSGLVDIAVKTEVDTLKRISWSVGGEVVAGYSSGNDYMRWNKSDNSWSISHDAPSSMWIQQLYGEFKHRAVLVRIGQKTPTSQILDETVSSGDLTRSGNARGIPGISAGFIDFQDIPFTRGLFQIEGVVDYGAFTDNAFRRKQYNYNSWLITQNTYYIYRRCYFRAFPKSAFSMTFGMQAAGQFGGSSEYYKKGELVREQKRGFKVADIFKMFLPTEGNGNSFYEGNSLGSWDFMARYQIDDNHRLSAGFQWPWEDGSGIGHRNGWDGLWGIYYKSSASKLVTAAAVEYLNFTNQSGPIHWAPGDHPGTTITGNASGGDNYYNNDTYCAYTNYGMAIATPFLVAPIYNLNGFPAFMHNCARGCHFAVRGSFNDRLQYSAKYSYQIAWGYGRTPSPQSYEDNSAMLSLAWNPRKLVSNFTLHTTVAMDRGTLRGNNIGVLFGIKYNGLL